MDIQTQLEHNNNSNIKTKTNEKNEEIYLVTKDDTNNTITIQKEKKYNNSNVDWSKLSWTLQNL